MVSYQKANDINFDNATQVLANAFFHLQSVYGEMLVCGQNMTAASELGLTVRVLAQELARTTSPEAFCEDDQFGLNEDDESEEE